VASPDDPIAVHEHGANRDAAFSAALFRFIDRRSQKLVHEKAQKSLRSRSRRALRRNVGVLTPSEPARSAAPHRFFVSIA
jgi:hypothetical protein